METYKLNHLDRFKIGDRVGFSRKFLKNTGVQATDPMWRLHGVVVGKQKPNIVRVKFDGEESPRSVAAANLAKPGTLPYCE